MGHPRKKNTFSCFNINLLILILRKIRILVRFCLHILLFHHFPSYLMYVRQMKSHFCFRLNLNAANFASFIRNNFIFVLFFNVQVHSPFLCKTLARAVRAFVNLLARMNSKMNLELGSVAEPFSASRDVASEPCEE